MIPEPDERSRARVGRWAGACGLGLIVVFVAQQSAELLGLRAAQAAHLIHSTPDPQEAIRFAGQNTQAFSTNGFATALLYTVLSLQLMLLVAITRDRGLLARMAETGAAALFTIGWIQAAVTISLGEVAHRGGADAGVLTLYSLALTIGDHATKIPIAAALGCLAVLLIRSRAVPPVLGWLTAAVAALNAAAVPAVIAGAGIGDLLAYALTILWALAIGVTLLIKPVWGPIPRESSAATTRTVG
jgi:hypothetical protein